jgi:hypothetical protein
MIVYDDLITDLWQPSHGWNSYCNHQISRAGIDEGLAPDSRGDGTLQSRYQVYVFLLAAILLTGMCQKPSSREVYPAPFSTYQHSTANAGHAIQTTEFNGVGDSVELEYLEGIDEVLSMTETGRTALHLIDKYEITLNFELGAGSRFCPGRNEIVIDSRLGHFSAALVLIHEVTHARYFHERATAEATILNRQAYVRQRMEEEVDAMVASIEATIELYEAGVEVRNIRPSLYYPYRQAYGSAFRAAKFDYCGLSDATLQRIGRTAGRSAVLGAVLDGQVLTSITGQTYMEYYGSLWDSKREHASNPT